MSAPNTLLNLQPIPMIRAEAQPPVFGIESVLQQKPSRSLPLRVAVIGNHLPRQCGIATFTTDLCDAITAEYGSTGLSVVAVNDPQSSYAYPKRVRFEIAEGDIATYRAAAAYLNSSNIDLVCLQHEYGIYGGIAGSYVLQLLQHLIMPVVTTLHTILREPDPYQRIVMQEIAARSARLIVMSEYSSRILEDVFDSPGREDRPDSSWHSRLALCGAGRLQRFALSRGQVCLAHLLERFSNSCRPKPGCRVAFSLRKSHLRGCESGYTNWRTALTPSSMTAAGARASRRSRNSITSQRPPCSASFENTRLKHSINQP
jgi:hypothetical protein